MAKIYVVVRTRDEKARIAQFCEAYKDADKILVADGGSEDDTIEIAKTFPNVEVRHFTERTEMEHGYWRNNDSDHANFLFEWAREENPDWIIYDDCDCRPNRLLREGYRSLLEKCSQNYVMAVRLYVWGTDGEHFPNMSKPGAKNLFWETSLYAWRGRLDLHTVNVPPAYTFRIGKHDIKDFRDEDGGALELLPPYCLLHYSWDNEELTTQKVKEYDMSGLIPQMQHPLDFAGHLEDLPEWAVE